MFDKEEIDLNWKEDSKQLNDVLTKKDTSYQKLKKKNRKRLHITWVSPNIKEKILNCVEILSFIAFAKMNK